MRPSCHLTQHHEKTDPFSWPTTNEPHMMNSGKTDRNSAPNTIRDLLIHRQLRHFRNALHHMYLVELYAPDLNNDIGNGHDGPTATGQDIPTGPEFSSLPTMRVLTIDSHFSSLTEWHQYLNISPIPFRNISAELQAETKTDLMNGFQAHYWTNRTRRLADGWRLGRQLLCT